MVDSVASISSSKGELAVVKTAPVNKFLPPFSSCCGTVLDVGIWLSRTGLFRPSHESMYLLSFKDLSLCCPVDVLE